MPIKRTVFAICLAIATSSLLEPVTAAILSGGVLMDEQTSIGYDSLTGELFVDAPSSVELTSIRVGSTAAVFTAEPAQNLVLAPAGFDIDEDDTIFKSTIGSSFGSLSFGQVAQPGLSEAFLLSDFEVIGSLAGGGDLGAVDLIYRVPEPATFALAILVAGSMFFCSPT